MKKSSLYLGAAAVAGVLTLAMPVITNAQDAGNRAPGNREDGSKPTRMQNIQNNRDIRNTKLADNRRMGTSTNPQMRGAMMPLALPAWIREKGPFKNGTSTDGRPNFLRQISTTTIANHQKLREIQLDKFAFLQTNLINRARHALAELKDVRAKLADRIQKAEASGRTMTDAKAALAIADQKITAAETAIKGLEAYVPPAVASSTNATATTAVKLEKPREIGKGALEALKSAKEALKDVISAIAHNMGLKKGQDGRFEHEDGDNQGEDRDHKPSPTVSATSTPSSTATMTATPTTTATSTATPTVTSTPAPTN